MKRKLKRGDLVVCIDNKGQEMFLTKGRLYKVARICIRNTNYIDLVNNLQTEFRVNRFLYAPIGEIL